MMLLIDTLAYNSKLFKISPQSKILFGMLPLIICLSFNSFYVSISTIIIMSFCTVKYGKLTFIQYKNLMFIPFGFLIIGTITIMFVKININIDADTVIFKIIGLDYGITKQSFTKSIFIILRALGSVTCMYFICVNTCMDDILYALKYFKTPSVFISLMELTYRYIFVFLEELYKIKIAQQSRLGYINFKTSIKSTAQLLASLFLRIFIKCDKVYNAMESRGYDGEIRFLKRKYNSSNSIYVSCFFISIFLICIGVFERSLI